MKNNKQLLLFQDSIITTQISKSNTMKTLFFLFATTFLFCSASYGQTDYSRITVNGKEKQTYFSRSEKNFIIIDGYCCKEFRLTAKGIELLKENEGYLVVLPEENGTATIMVSGLIEGKWFSLYTQEFKIQD